MQQWRGRRSQWPRATSCRDVSTENQCFVTKSLPTTYWVITCSWCVMRCMSVPSVRLRCWLGASKSIRPVNVDWWGVGVVIRLERGADCLHMVQLMPLPSPKPRHLLPQTGFTFVVPAYLCCTSVSATVYTIDCQATLTIDNAANYCVRPLIRWWPFR